MFLSVFWSFRSPYSYLVTPRLVALERDYEVEVRVRPVLPIAVRIKDFFQQVNPLWPPYLLRDIVRVAEYNGMTIAWPQPDPIVQDFMTRKVADEQPYIYRLTRLGVDAVSRGRGLAFVNEVSHLIWSGKTSGWHEGSHLAEAAARAGLDLAQMDAAIAAEPQKYDAIIEQNQADLNDAGHWGVPTMVFEGEPFFGQDRFDLLVWRLRQHGMRKRSV